MTRLRLAVLAGVAALALAAPPAHALKVATWNLLKYAPTALNWDTRETNIRTAIAALDPDVVVCQELDSAAGRDSFLTNVLNAVEPGQWTGSAWISVRAFEGMAVFWKTSKATVFSAQAISTTGTRDFLVCGVRPLGYGASSFFRLASMHLKAGNTDQATRLTECNDIRNWLNTVPTGGAFLLMGDSNFYGDNEPGYGKLLESQADNDGRCVDPLAPMSGIWNNSFYAPYHTQCPCTSCLNADFSGGGLDDRFDVAFPSYSMVDGAGLDLVPGSTNPFGNDGLHYNQAVNGSGFNNAVPLSVANALAGASDHLPVSVIVQLPAKVSAVSQLDVGRAIQGSTATATLLVSDLPAPPADELNYSLIAPAGFTAPGGGFTANAGAGANAHTIGLDTSTLGARNGLLIVSSNDPDSASKKVTLSGVVLRHAVASLDSASIQISSFVTFGNGPMGEVEDTFVRVHNQGYDALQARLSVPIGTITGGGGRFSIAGFPSVLVAGVGAPWPLHFDATGATLDSTYSATLTFQGADEPIPGAAAAAPLTVTLLARAGAGTAGVPGAGLRAPRLEPARPNPMSGSTEFAFELPANQRASLEIYDLGGRRVASLVSGEQGAGRHRVSWQGRDGLGARVPGGLYFARFSTPGLRRVERLIVLP